jgi:uncharacterized membrane protein YeaQ/YmgE (transglycosylase-associated protein family)
MGSFGLLLITVAVLGAICGVLASAVARRNRRHARGFFLVGFFCGWTAKTFQRRRRRRLNALGFIRRGIETLGARV